LPYFIFENKGVTGGMYVSIFENKGVTGGMYVSIFENKGVMMAGIYPMPER
jgi:hypothetical protein